MKELEAKILSEGKILPGHILKVGNFLNQQIDTGFMLEMGKEVAILYDGEKIDKVLTIEASGIPFAFAIALALGNLPVVFAKKNNTSNIGSDTYSASVHSYTHNRDYNIVVSKEYISENDNVLIADDFLACGNALNGLIKLCNDAGANVVGCAIAIEKGFQGGGDALRKNGVRVESLAIVDEMTDDGRITYRQ